MSRVLVVGAGRVGTETARQLAGTEGIDEVHVVDRDKERVERVARELGEGVAAGLWSPDQPLPQDVSAVAVALPRTDDVPVVERALDAGVPAATCADDPSGIRRLLAADPVAVERRVAVALGSGLAPGVSELLAQHGAGGLDHVDEVHVARYGFAGPACKHWRRRAVWGAVQEFDGGAWARRRSASGRRLVYFPGPVGPVDCRRARNGVARLLIDGIDGVTSATYREAVRHADRITGGIALPPGRGAREGLGAVHVEVRGRRGNAREVLTFGMVDRMAVAAGTVLAVAAAAAGRLIQGLEPIGPGVRSPAALFPVGAFLGELARRGVRGARFVGADAS